MKGAGLIGLAIKLGPKIVAAFAKIGPKAALAGASFAGYAAVFTWKFAVLLMVAVFIHESGHVWAMKKLGMKTKGFYFIPFFGGVAVGEGSFKSPEGMVFVAIMGPVWGFVTAIIPAGIYVFIHQHPLWAAAAAWIAMLNLLNLLPIYPLDGGRIFKAVAFAAGTKAGYIYLILGTAAGVILMFVFGLGLFAILLFIGALELIPEFKARARVKHIIEKVEWIRTASPSELRKDVIATVPNAEMLSDENMEWVRADALKDLDPLVRPFRSLTKVGAANTIFHYGLLVFALWSVMAMFANVPGADIAVQFMQ